MSQNLFSSRPHAHHQSHESSGDHYLSISDLMSGVVLILCLMVIVFAVQYEKNLDVLKEKEKRVEEMESEIKRKEAKIKKIEEDLKKIRSVRKDIILGLTETFRAENISAEIDQKTGDVSIKESLLFASGKYNLNSDGLALLTRLIPTYRRVVFSNDQFRSAISHISIEGHASRAGDAVQNMNLSVERAAEVYRFIEQKLGYPLTDPLVQSLLIAGRGELEADQETDRSEDRRVVFRFRFKADEQALEILKGLTPSAQER